MVPGEQKYTEKDVLDPSVLCGSQPASWVSATVSWLLCVVAYWSHPWWHVEFSILHMPELVSFMARLVMDEFQRSSIRVPAVMTALGKGAVNCSKPCSGLVKSWCGAGSERHTRLSLVKIRIMLKLFMSLPLGACSSCTVLWMLLPKKPLKEESPKHFCFIHCEKIVDCCTSCFYRPPCAIWTHIWKYLILSELDHWNLSLMFPGKIV